METNNKDSRTCKTCSFWNPCTGFFNEGKGKCHEIRTSDLLDIEIRTGWDGGYVDNVYTYGDFGCIHHKSKGVKEYTVGIMFDIYMRFVVLILKNRPEWQVGLYNFPGGKIEEGESPSVNIAREIKEECSLETSPYDWQLAGKIVGSDEYLVNVFTCVYKESFGLLKKGEDQEVSWAHVEEIKENIVPNLSWLIPYALDFLKNNEVGGKLKISTFCYE